MKVVYISGPFRAINPDGTPDMFAVQQNVMRAMALGLQVWKRGHVALIPHSNTMFFTGAAGLSDDVWLEGDLELVRRCDAVLLTDDWARSRGAYAEKLFAESLGVPTFQRLEDLDDWLTQLEVAAGAATGGR